MGAILTQDWLTQAPFPATLNRNHPLSGNLIGGFLHPAASLGGIASTGALSVAGVSRYAALVSASSSSVRTFPGIVSPQTSGFTAIIIATRFGAQPDSGFGVTAQLPQLSGIQDPFIHFTKDLGERIRFNTTTSDLTGNSWETAEDWVIGQWMVGAYVYQSGVVPAIYRDGRSITLSTSPGSITGTLKPSNSLQVNFATFRINGAVAGQLYFNRALSQAEVQEISRNPWVFAESSGLDLIIPTAATGSPYTLTAAAGAFTETGQDAGLIAARTVTGEAGTFSESGQDAGLLATRTIGGDAGAFTLTGQDAALTYTPAGAYSMPAAAGSFTEAGQDAALLYARLMASDAGAFAFTGQDASLVYTPAGSYSMSAAAGSFAMTGQAATLTGPFVALPNRRRIGRASMTAANARIGGATGRPINARIGD